MHGRVKVRSPAEQEERKRREREAKVQLYRKLTQQIYAKRSAGEQDGEALVLTGKVLVENPDIGTFWNYRREIIESRLQSWPADEAGQLCSEELALLERCLLVNPKSYCVWFHRAWILGHAPAPDWLHEKSLCNRFLKYDERNFHCWDYRRLVVSKAQVAPDDELSFSQDKIHSNFSNYSAWHYRSKLLPLLGPAHPHQEGGVAPDTLSKEYELAHNAFYTDPSDQSAWFYHRWLLGKDATPTALSCLLCRRTDTLVTVTVLFSKPVQVTEGKPLLVTMGDASVLVAPSDRPERLWECSLPGAEGLAVSVHYGTLSASLSIQPGSQETWWAGPQVEGARLAASEETLSAELECCQELLQLEPNNKWCLLTTLELMAGLGRHRFSDDILSYLDRLIAVDPPRKGHYQDLRSRHRLFCQLGPLWGNPPSHRRLDLSNKELTLFCHTPLMLLFTTVDLSCNRLSSLAGVHHLRCMHTLLLQHNRLQELPREMGQLSCLRVLSLDDNKLASLEAMEGLRGLGLETLSLAGNPVCELDAPRLQAWAAALFPQLAQLGVVPTDS